MNLHELLNSDVKVEFDDSVGEELFYAYATIGGREIVFSAEEEANPEEDGWWSVAFAEQRNGETAFQTFSLTKSGNEFQVFSMVKQCFERFIKEKKPNVILFTADKSDKSRAQLYERMLKKFLRGYTFKKYEKNSRQVGFKLEKMK